MSFHFSFLFSLPLWFLLVLDHPISPQVTKMKLIWLVILCVVPFLSAAVVIGAPLVAQKPTVSVRVMI